MEESKLIINKEEQNWGEGLIKDSGFPLEGIDTRALTVMAEKAVIDTMDPSAALSYITKRQEQLVELRKVFISPNENLEQVLAYLGDRKRALSAIEKPMQQEQKTEGDQVKRAA